MCHAGDCARVQVIGGERIQTDQFDTEMTHQSIFKLHCKMLDMWCNFLSIDPTIYVVVESNLPLAAELHGRYMNDYIVETGSTRFKFVVSSRQLPRDYINPNNGIPRYNPGISITGVKSILVTGVANVVNCKQLRFLAYPVTTTAISTRDLSVEIRAPSGLGGPVRYIPSNGVGVEAFTAKTRVISEYMTTNPYHKESMGMPTELPLFPKLILSDLGSFMCIYRAASGRGADSHLGMKYEYTGKTSGGTDDLVCALMLNIYSWGSLVDDSRSVTAHANTRIIEMPGPYSVGIGVSTGKRV